MIRELRADEPVLAPSAITGILHVYTHGVTGICYKSLLQSTASQYRMSYAAILLVR